jgi:hypothetical protein
MSRIIKWAVFSILCSAFFASGAHAKSITAADCSQASVAAAVAQAANGDTVLIPSCGQTNWAANLTVTKCVDIQGAGQNNTTLGDNVAKLGSDQSVLILFNVSCGGTTFGLHDLTIVGVAPDAQVFNKGHIRILGSGTAGFHIHHITGTNMQTAFATFNWVGPGLFDHLSFPNCGASKGEINGKASAWGGGSFGDGSWSDTPPTSQEANQIYVEDSTWTCSGLAPSQATDGDSGTRMVFRFNTLRDANNGDHGADSSGRERSGRWQETYKNSYTFDPTEAPAFVDWYRGGSGIFWGNSITAQGGGVNRYAYAGNFRDSQSFGPWGMCNGTGIYDQNASNGYRCVDQPGAGQSFVISGGSGTTQGPTTVNGNACSSGPCWIGNALEPIYEFLNTGTPTTFPPDGTPNVQLDRDIYWDGKGSLGVRSGTFANIPTTCTTGQGYWATDQGLWNSKTPGVAAGQLYKCSATNTWTLYYTPYTYPHPLQAGAATPPAPPTGLQSVVH